MTDILRLIDHPLVATLGWTLTHFVWQGALLGLGAFFVLRVFRPAQASTRYLVGVATLALMLLAPVATFISSSGYTASSRRASTPAAPLRTSQAGLVTGAIVANTPANPAKVRELAPAGGRASRADTAIAPVWLPLVTAAWMVGVGVLSLRMLGGWVLTQMLARRAVTVVGDEVQSAAREMARRLRLRRRFAVLQSSAVVVPTLVGWLKPVVLLPASALSGLSPVQLQAVIAHELAHIRRHDYLVNVLQTAVETLLFYHPAVWWVSSEVRAEREHCCDDLAVEVCGDRLVYVSALAELTTMERRAFALAATDGSLLTRVRRILGRPADARRELPPSWGVLALLIVVGGGAGTYEMSAGAQDVAGVAQAAAAPVRSAQGEAAVQAVPSTAQIRQSPWSPFGEPLPPVPPDPPTPPAPPEPPLVDPPPAVDVMSPPAPPAPAAPPAPPASHAPPAPPAAFAPVAPFAPPAPPAAVPAQAPPAPEAPPAPPAPAAPAAPPAPPTLSAPAAPAPPPLLPVGQRSHGNWVWNDDNERLAVRWTGEFRLSDDERDIGWVEQGATVTISDGWVFTDRAEFRGIAGGQVERRFYRSGVERPFDSAAQTFVTTALQRMLRSGMFASERVARFLKQGGVDAVLAEIARLSPSSSHVKRVYYSALLKQADLTAPQLTRVLDRVAADVTSDYEKATLLVQILNEAAVTDEQRVLVARAARTINSDYEARKVLVAAMAPAAVSPAVASAILEAIDGIASSYERSVVLRTLAGRGGVTPQTSERFMAAVGAMSSSHEQRQVLSSLVAQGGTADRAVVAPMLGVAARVTSSHDKAQILLDLIARRGVTDAVAPGFFTAANSISSSHDQARVLRALLATGRLSDTLLAGVLESATKISSSHDRATLLLEVLKTQEISGAQRTRFIEAAESISSAHDQTRVLAALVRSERR